MTDRASKISILAIGSEILDGRVLDTNSRFVSQQLSNHEIYLDQILTCDDNQDQIVAALKYLFESVNVVICSGGLGPTSDDLTREAVAQFAAVELKEDAQVLVQLKQRFEKRQRPFDPSNVKQAFFPDGSKIIANPVGTAAGFATQAGNNLVVALPGVPSELQKMFEACLKLVTDKFPRVQKLNTHSFKTFGLPEATVGTRVQGCNLPQEVVVSYRASFPDVEVKLKSLKNIDSEINLVRAALEPQFIFTEDPLKTFPQILLQAMITKKHSFAVIDQVTGGVLSQFLHEADLEGQSYVGSILVRQSQPIAPDLKGLKADIYLKLECLSQAIGEYQISVEYNNDLHSKKLTARFDSGFLERYLSFCAMQELLRHISK